MRGSCPPWEDWIDHSYIIGRGHREREHDRERVKKDSFFRGKGSNFVGLQKRNAPLFEGQKNACYNV